MMLIPERLFLLRQQMRTKGMNAYIVPGNDPHASEYRASHWQEMSWLSGFTGDAGTVVVTLEKALLWTDSRFYLQADVELNGTGICLMRESDVDCPSISDWLCQNVQGVVGVNPEMYSVNEYHSLQQTLSDGGLQLCSADLIRDLWTIDRPAIPMSPAEVYPESFAGESAVSKISRVRQVLTDKHCDAMVISALDEIGWFLNIRGRDVDFVPCVIAYVVLEKHRCTLFIEAEKVSPEVRTYLNEIGVTLAPYESVFSYLHTLSSKGVLLDGARVNEALYEAIASEVRKCMLTPSPVQVMMSVKNAVEIEGERLAMREDAVALTRFFVWLEEAVKQQLPLDEVKVGEMLQSFRAKGKNYVEDSFATIAGWQANGAIVHYTAVPDKCSAISGNGVLLLDSGGQYLDGTTDITRTLWLGDTFVIPTALKHDYTLVLKGHIALACARFPKGTRGNQLDILAHQFMWAEGITYGHGTGHGVGHYMGCHEGPSNIRTDNNPNPIRLGQVFSDEPGIYRAGEYGIRIENLITAVEAPATEHTTGEQYFEFETLTLCPYDTSLIVREMLTEQEREWINAYHDRVYREIAPLLNANEKEFLKTKTQHI